MDAFGQLSLRPGRHGRAYRLRGPTTLALEDSAALDNRMQPDPHMRVAAA